MISKVNNRISIPPLGIDPPVANFSQIAPSSAFFAGYLPKLGHVLTIIFENNKHLLAISITKFGVSTYKNLILNPTSRFWPSCENLAPEYANSPVRRALAVSNLKNFSRLVNNPPFSNFWDETDAGSLANSMQLLTTRTPVELGDKLLDMGLIQEHTVKSVVLDTIYDNLSSSDTIIEENNRLVNLMGEQLDQLFDPLLEYSPEAMRITYVVPTTEEYVAPLVNSPHIVNVISELLSVQTNFTMGLVNLLQNFVIPLRIHVLAVASKKTTQNTGIAKINLVFPPTIDEITRINCILHEALTRAARYGYVEVFKVMSMVLPYFYKAFIRHEANLKSFSSRLKRFRNRNGMVFENLEINKGKYSTASIEAIVVGSLMELPKIRLILVRLANAVKSGDIQEDADVTANKSGISQFDNLSSIDKISHTGLASIDKISYIGQTSIDKISYNGQTGIDKTSTNVDKIKKARFSEEPQTPLSEAALIESYFKSSIDVINAFGNDSVEETSRQRIFTPSGKLLPELASLWPPELQHNALTRKVVGIFELILSTPTLLHNIDIAIIFSDYLLFLTIDDNKYYLGESPLSVADVLMHSLINEKPLPEVDFPLMVVSAWCDVNDVAVTVYDTQHLRFISTAGGFLEPASTACGITAKSYHYAEPHKVVELLDKAKVLHKSQPFHLFKSSGELDIYSTAHQIDAYELENCKSPFALFLNVSIDEPVTYFKSHPGLHLIVQAAFITEELVHIMSYNRKGDFVYNEVVHTSNFQMSVQDIVSKNYGLMYGTFAPVIDALSRSYEHDLEYFVSVFTGYDRQQMINYAMKAEEERGRVEKIRLDKEKQRQVEIKKARDADLKKREAELRKKESTKKASAKNEPELKKKKSFMSKLFGGFKRKDKKVIKKVVLIAEIGAPVEIPGSPVVIPGSGQATSIKPHGSLASMPTTAISRPVIPSAEQNISNTYIPRGKRPEYGNLFAPVPELKVGVPVESSPRPESSPRLLLRQKLSNMTLGSAKVSEPDQTIELQRTETLTNHSIKLANHSLKLALKQRQISQTEKNAIALDRLELRKSSQPLVPPIDLEHIPLREFYGDGESNWTSFSRDNSSLYEDIQKLKALSVPGTRISSLQSAATKRSMQSGRSAQSAGSRTTAQTKSSTRITPRMSSSALSNQSTEFSKRSIEVEADLRPRIDSHLSKNTLDLLGQIHASMLTFEIPTNYFRKEDSIQSLTLTQAIEEFKKNIQFGHSMNDIASTLDDRDGSTVTGDKDSLVADDKSLVSDADEIAKRFEVVKKTNMSLITLTSSEDEFYSPDEFDFGSIDFSKMTENSNLLGKSKLTQRKSKVPVHVAQSNHDSLSSEATVTSITRSATEKDLAIPRDCSIAYLLRFLDGSIELESFT